MRENKKFFELLIKKNIVNQENLDSLIEIYDNDSFDILNHLVENNIADKHKLGKLWGDSFGIPYVDLNQVEFNEDLLQELPYDFAKTNKIIPIYQMGNAIAVATARPQNKFLLNKLKEILQTNINPWFCFEDDIKEAVDRYYCASGFEQKKIKKAENISSASDQEVIRSEQKKYLVENARQFMDDIRSGKPSDPAIANNITSMITDQITDKIDLGFCISQLRINDEHTYSHSINTAILASIMGKIMGFSPTLIKELTLGALLHDVGKMRIPKVILYKTDPFTQEEMDLKKRHTILGHDIVKKMGFHDKVAEVALYHHETMNGRGYPIGLKGEDIPLNAQIVAIVNLFDDLLSDKPNYEAITYSEAINVMLIEGAPVFNLGLLQKFVKIAYKNDIISLKKIFKTSVFGELV